MELTRRAALFVAALACAAAARAQTPRTFGPGVTYFVVDASELAPYVSGNPYGGTGTLRYASAGTGYRLVATLHLPSGAAVVSMELYYYDVTPSGSAVAALGVCDNAPGTCVGVSSSGGCVDGGATVCSGTVPAAGSGSALASVGGLTIDNVAHQYIVAAGTSSNDGSTAISEIRIGYVLQVSPPPGGATFADVPPNHPLFQFIEALAASGITGGCGSGNYCPDAPLTRGQMAVFLAKALGLQWN